MSTHSQKTKHARYSGTYANLVTASVKLSLATAALWATLFYYQSNINPVSRRMANLPYVIWMVCFLVIMAEMARWMIVDESHHYHNDYYRSC